MLELAAGALTMGALFYHNLHADFFTLALVAFSAASLIGFVFRSIRGILFAFVISSSFVIGAVAVWATGKDVPDIFGNRAFDGEVLFVDRRLDKTNILVREEGKSAKIEFSLYEETKILPGDKIAVRATIEKPEAFTTATGRIFDYPHYLESKGIVGIGKNVEISLREEGRFSIARIATTIRFHIAEIFARYISFPVDGVIAGMTVGYQGGLPKDIQNLFRDTGVLHVLVLSGYNITLLAGFLGLLLRGISFRMRTVLTIAAIVMLVIISGSGVASIRAGIMGGIALFAGLAVRTYRPLRALTLSYLFFFFLSPITIFYDPGFHLSFLATAFMVLVLAKTEGVFSFLPKTKGVNFRELFMLALLIPLFMLPYTMYFSGVVPPASPVANIILALAAPILMILGIAVLTVSWVAPLAHVVGIFASAIGSLVVSILEILTKLPSINTPTLPWWGASVFYATFFFYVFRKELTRYLSRLQNLLLPDANSFD